MDHIPNQNPNLRLIVSHDDSRTLSNPDGKPLACPFRQPMQQITPDGLGRPQVTYTESVCGSWCALFKNQIVGPIAHITQHCCDVQFVCSVINDKPKSDLKITL